MGSRMRLRRLSSPLLALTIIAQFTATLAVVEGSPMPYMEKWGIYELDPATGNVKLIYTSPYKMTTLRLNGAGDAFVFSMRIDEDDDASEEICVIGVDGDGLTRLTDNALMDVYPAWSPDGSKIAFLSMRGQTLDIYVMDADGENEAMLYDSGYHDADIHWVGGRIAFTRNFQIWVIEEDGTGARRVSDPPRAGEWGDAVLPFGDYDPRISPDGGRIVFERMVDDASPHGNYDLFTIGVDGSEETRLTETGWTQGLASWSHSGEWIVCVVSAVGTEGRYDLHLMNTDGSGVTDLTSEIFPPGFLTHCAVFSADDSRIYFVGEWWDWKVLDTSLSCSLSSRDVELGDSLTVSGSIEPPIPDANIILKYTGPDGNVITKGVTAGTDGAYTDAFEPSDEGSWGVEAIWEGDPGHNPSTSGTKEFTVTEPKRESEAESGGEVGIPGFPWESTMLGLAAGLSVLLMLRRRQRRGLYPNNGGPRETVFMRFGPVDQG
jgi:Tol biopolymer transport system component